MHPLIIHRIATTAIMPLVAMSGFAGYSYYQNPNSEPVQTCTVLSTDTGFQYGNPSDVLMLQRFLIASGYMRGTPTGQFGQATFVSLERFQADNGIPITGVTDWQTRTRIQQLSCIPTPAPVYPPQQYPVQNNQLSVQGIDAPSTLTVGQSGSWSIRLLSYQGSGQLQYSVVWGDENNGMRAAATSYYNALPVQASGTFTHVYTRAGTYTAVFTITDGYGHQTQASATTYVSGGQYPYQDWSYTYPNSSYCTTYAGRYDRSCTSTVQPTYYPTTYPTNNPYSTGYPSGCTSSYDRSCYVNGQYIGPAYGSASYGYQSQNNYPSTYGGTSNDDYSCYYDRACLARLEGRSY